MCVHLFFPYCIDDTQRANQIHQEEEEEEEEEEENKKEEEKRDIIDKWMDIYG